MSDENRAVAPDADSVAVEIGDTMLVLDAEAAADLRGRLGLALGELRAEQSAD